MAGEQPVEIAHGDRVLRFRGQMDRVDRTDDGGLYVLDYKAGSPGPYKGLDVGDPVARGTRLQLSLYARAAEARFGATGPVRAGYAFLHPQAREPIGYELDAERRARFEQVTAVLADGVAAGAFPPNPGAYDSYMARFDNCAWCAYDRCCPADRDAQWDALVDAPELAPYMELATGDEVVPGDADEAGERS
jgi:hypothetical protein